MIYQHVFPYIAEFIRLCGKEDSEELLTLIESWEIVNAFLSAEPMTPYKENDIRDFLNKAF